MTDTRIELEKLGVIAQSVEREMEGLEKQLKDAEQRHYALMEEIRRIW